MVRLNATRRIGVWLVVAARGARIDGRRKLRSRKAARGGMLDCLPIGQPLPKIPEIATQRTSGVAGAANLLRGTILLANERQRLVMRQPTGGGNVSGKPGLYFVCQEQIVRVFRGLDAKPPMPLVPQNRIGDPIPGPTLRARLGDIVQLTFVNNINPGQFPYSIDQAENQTQLPPSQQTAAGCDSSTSGYPTAGGDAFPDCFHGSSTGNIHFHGTHTNPNSTGDNVFLEVRPSPIVNGKPTVTDKTVAKPFNDFFKACYDRLKGNVLLEWPTTWNDAPLGPWNICRTADAAQSQNLDRATGAAAASLRQGQDTLAAIVAAEPAADSAEPLATVLHRRVSVLLSDPREGSAESTGSGTLKMGQSPGTHWYHAHKHGSTAINVANGMTGVFVIEGRDLRRQAERVVRPGLDAAPAHPGDQSTWRHAEPAAFRARPDRQRPRFLGQRQNSTSHRHEARRSAAVAHRQYVGPQRRLLPRARRRVSTGARLPRTVCSSRMRTISQA